MPAKTKKLKRDLPELSLDVNTIAGAGRSAILAGLSNPEVLAAIKGAHPSFPVDKRAYYARWYRAQLVMLGVLKKDDRRAHAAGALPLPK